MNTFRCVGSGVVLRGPWRPRWRACIVLFMFLFRMVLCRSPIDGQDSRCGHWNILPPSRMESVRFSSRTGRQPPRNIACFLNSTASQVPETDLGIFSTPKPFCQLCAGNAILTCGTPLLLWAPLGGRLTMQYPPRQITEGMPHWTLLRAETQLM